MMNELLNFLNNNFETILVLNALWVIALGVTFAFARLRQLTVRKVGDFTSDIFFLFLAGLEICVLLVSGYVYWFNYKHSVPFTMEEKVLSNTHWVKDDLTVYYMAGNDLVATQVNGDNKKYIYEGTERVREYHFSPDGRYILIVTFKKLVLLDRRDDHSETVDSMAEAAEDVSSLISNVLWSPDSQKFFYSVAHWSKISSNTNYYLWYLKDKTKTPIKSPTRKLTSPYWDTAGQNLYLVETETMLPKAHGYLFVHQIYKIDSATLTTELIDDYPSQKALASEDRLEAKKIKLFKDAHRYSFGADESVVLRWRSPSGREVGLDDEDYLYYVNNQWFRKRLFHVEREALEGDIRYHQFEGGVLAIKQLKWLPGGRYAILAHKKLGVLILDPKSGKLGQLAGMFGSGFGWYEK